MTIPTEPSIDGTISFRDTSRLSIPVPLSLPRLTLPELRIKLPWIKEIERDSSPTSPVTFKLGTVFPAYEQDGALISCEEFERTILPMQDKLLGYQQGILIVNRQGEFPEMRELEGKANILLPGLIIMDNSGDRRMFFLGSGGTGWWLSWRILNHRTGFSPRDLIAYSG